MTFGFTSSSRASSLMRILLILDAPRTNFVPETIFNLSSSFAYAFAAQPGNFFCIPRHPRFLS
jgi:hypothetical protein